MKPDLAPNTAVGASGREHARHAPDGGGRLSTRSRILMALSPAVGMLILLLIVAPSTRVNSQTVQLVTVDVNVVAQGYRISKLTGSSITNEKNEKIGSIDDFVVARDRSLFAVLQVGGFLGMGAHLIAVPYESLNIDDEGRAIQLPGASKDELMKLPEIKYRH